MKGKEYKMPNHLNIRVSRWYLAIAIGVIILLFKDGWLGEADTSQCLSIEHKPAKIEAWFSKRYEKKLPELRKEFWNNVKITGENTELNQELEKAGRVADFLELGELMAYDALMREESCGGHFREEHQTDENEAKRNDANFSHVASWNFTGIDNKPTLTKEDLTFENVKLSSRSYK